MANMPPRSTYAPSRRRFAKASKRRAPYRRRMQGPRTLALVQPGDFAAPSNSWYPLGSSRVSKLVYHEIFTIDPGASSVGVYAFRANGMYDPNYTSTGHQPYGFDQLMALYKHYAVLGSRCTATIIPGGTMTAIPFILGIKVSSNAAPATTNAQLLMEEPGWVSKTYGNPSATNELSVATGYSTSKFNGGLTRREIMAKDSFCGLSNADPTDPVFFQVCFAPAISSQDLPNITFQVRIEYTAAFWQPNELRDS